MKISSKVIFNQFIHQLTIDESPSEKEAIARLLFESEFGLSYTEILMGKEIQVHPEKIEEWAKRVSVNEPVQYILGVAVFCRRKFKVDSSVLIPRPETELLAYEVLNENLQGKSILDIGTGSGCIAVTLKLEVPQAQVYAIEVSEEALRVAKENALTLNADVKFIHGNFLEEVSIPMVDVIVSNPPYIGEREKKSMRSNVLQYEPHLALFVPDHDPLLFYKAIAIKSKNLLKTDGKIVVEINERYGKQVKELFEVSGYKSVQIIQDLDGRDRIVSAR